MKSKGTFVQRKYKFDSFFCGSIFERVIARAGRDMDGEREKAHLSRDWIMLRSIEGPECMVREHINNDLDISLFSPLSVFSFAYTTSFRSH